MRRENGGQSISHRKGGFTEGDSYQLFEFTEVDISTAHVNLFPTEIELALERRGNVNRRKRFVEDLLGYLLHDYFKPSASALSAFGGRRPSKNATTLFAAMTAIFVRVSIEALAM